MSKKALTEVEAYLIGRIARLEALIRNYSDKEEKLAGTRSALAEARLLLKKVREIAASA
jgi:head-tail adaptor